MQKKIHIMLLFTVTAVALIFCTEAYASAASPTGGAFATMDEVYCDVRDLTTGNLGTMIGFGFAFAGLLMLLLKGSNYGIFMIITGISVTAFPGLINSFIEGMSIAGAAQGAAKINIAACTAGELASANGMTDATRATAITRTPPVSIKDESMWERCHAGLGC